MKKVLVMMMFVLLAVSRCFADNAWVETRYDFHAHPKISVVYSMDPIYEDGHVDFYTDDKLVEYVYENVKGKCDKMGYIVEIGEDKVKGSDMTVSIYLKDYQEKVTHIEGYTYTRPVTKEKVIVKDKRGYGHPGKPGPHGKKEVTKVVVKERETVYVPGYDTTSTHVSVNYEVLDTKTGKKVFVMYDKERCDGSDVARAFKKSLKNFWKAFEKKALK